MKKAGRPPREKFPGKWEPTPDERYWIGEVTSHAVKTVLIRANSRKQAEQRLIGDDAGEYVEGVDVHYSERGRRVIREDKPRK